MFIHLPADLTLTLSWPSASMALTSYQITLCRRQQLILNLPAFDLAEILNLSAPEPAVT